MKQGWKKGITAAVFALLFILSLLVTFGAPLGVPSWQQVFSAAGLSDISQTTGDLTVHFIDVGKGDSILISGKDCNILIDAGPESLHQKTSAYLKKRGIEKLDLVVATHPDTDHIGDMWHVIENFKVSRFWMPGIPLELQPNTTSFEKLMNALTEKKVPVTYPQFGEGYNQEDIRVEVVSYTEGVYNNTNDYSVCLKLTYGEKSFLFMGDAQNTAEEDILTCNKALACDVLKAGHHGSSTSSAHTFIEAVKPKFGIISIGENTNNLPKKSVLNRLEKIGAQVYRTDESGTIVFVTDGENMQVITEKQGELWNENIDY